MKILRLLAVLLLASCMLPFVSAHAQGPIRIIFLHHSCGENLIDQGGVREGLTALGYEFYDHGYNGDGLRLADGSYTGTNYDVPDDNTDPDGLAAIFAQPLHDPPDNTFSHLMQYDVIAVKSCFPTSNIGSDEQLAEFQSYYLSMRARMDGYPERLFVIVTQPPQVPGASDSEEATRARALADGLASDEFLAGHPNVVTFDFFGYLAGDDNFLRPEYRVDDTDAHPNEVANQTIGPLFVDFIDQAIQGYFGSGPRPEPAATVLPEERPGGEPPAVALLPVAGMIDDFESGAENWYPDIGEGATVECGADAGAAHGGTSSLRLDYTIPPGSWAGCGRHFDSPQDWSGGSGLSLWQRSERPGQWVTLALFAGSAESPTPFEVGFETTGEWAQYAFSWTDFARAAWADPGGLEELDPARVTGLGFSIGADEGRVESTLWLDDIAAITDEEQPSQLAPPEQPAEGQEEGAPGGGFCSGAAALPLAVLSVVAAVRWRR
jgi:hypothetical protein